MSAARPLFVLFDVFFVFLECLDVGCQVFCLSILIRCFRGFHVVFCVFSCFDTNANVNINITSPKQVGIPSFSSMPARRSSGGDLEGYGIGRAEFMRSLSFWTKRCAPLACDSVALQTCSLPCGQLRGTRELNCELVCQYNQKPG